MAEQSLPAAAPPSTSSPPRVAAQPAAGSKRRVVAVVVVFVLAATALGYWSYSRRFESTDDAQVDGNITSVSPRASGNVDAVYVIENQSVKEGEVLATLDPVDLRIAVDQANAQVAQAKAQLAVEDPNVPIFVTSNQTALATAGSDLAGAQAALSAARKDVEQLTAQLAQATANDRTAQLEKGRADRLIAEGAIAAADHDQRVNAAEASTANLQALEQSLAGARDRVTQQQAQISALQSRYQEVESNAPRQLATRKASVFVRQAALSVAEAQLAEAQSNLSYARIVAPISGIVAKKAVSVGDHVAPGQEIIAISQVDGLWVTANFRETQLRQVQPGQSATVRIDALDADLHGSVESIGGATGSRLSVFPPENASGNYVKVVQRIPVRIHLDPGQPGMDRLRIGMSAEPKVTVR